MKRVLERQLLSMKNAMLVEQQARASMQFAESMNLMAKEIGAIYGELDLTKTQAQWEKSVAQAGSIEQRMEVFLDSMEQASGESATTGGGKEIVTDEEIDRMIAADVLADQKREIGKLDDLAGEIDRELKSARQKD